MQPMDILRKFFSVYIDFISVEKQLVHRGLMTSDDFHVCRDSHCP